MRETKLKIHSYAAAATRICIYLYIHFPYHSGSRKERKKKTNPGACGEGIVDVAAERVTARVMIRSVSIDRPAQPCHRDGGASSFMPSGLRPPTRARLLLLQQ